MPDAALEQIRPAEDLDPPQIASLYRLLRKALEDRKDEPGAADFYYGEMEMRRQRQPAERRPEGRATRDRGERVILTLYWLVSGYGLRASRALTALLITVVLFAVCFWAFGFDWPPGRSRDFIRALLFSVETASSLFRVPDTPGLSLSYGGEALQVALRLLGPLFLGLALLSLRGRVKR